MEKNIDKSIRLIIRDDGKDEHYWTNSTGNRFRSTWEGLTFEQVCKDHIMAIKYKLRIPGILTEESSWSQRGDTMNFEYIEITDISQLNVYIDDILKNYF